MSETTDPRQRALDKRRAREEQIHRLRMRIAAAAVALFIAAWGGLYVQLVNGDDPALADSASTVATQSADPEVTADDAWSDGTATPDGTTSTDEATQSSATPAAVTTGQS